MKKWILIALVPNLFTLQAYAETPRSETLGAEVNRISNRINEIEYDRSNFAGEPQRAEIMAREAEERRKLSDRLQEIEALVIEQVGDQEASGEEYLVLVHHYKLNGSLDPSRYAYARMRLKGSYDGAWLLTDGKKTVVKSPKHVRPLERYRVQPGMLYFVSFPYTPIPGRVVEPTHLIPTEMIDGANRVVAYGIDSIAYADLETGLYLARKDQANIGQTVLFANPEKHSQWLEGVVRTEWVSSEDRRLLRVDHKGKIYDLFYAIVDFEIDGPRRAAPEFVSSTDNAAQARDQYIVESSVDPAFSQVFWQPARNIYLPTAGQRFGDATGFSAHQEGRAVKLVRSLRTGVEYYLMSSGLLVSKSLVKIKAQLTKSEKVATGVSGFCGSMVSRLGANLKKLKGQ